MGEQRDDNDNDIDLQFYPESQGQSTTTLDGLLPAVTVDKEFKPGYQFYLAFSSLTVLAMMVSLDGTSVSVALPVGRTYSHTLSTSSSKLSEHSLTNAYRLWPRI